MNLDKLRQVSKPWDLDAARKFVLRSKVLSMVGGGPHTLHNIADGYVFVVVAFLL